MSTYSNYIPTNEEYSVYMSEENTNSMSEENTVSMSEDINVSTEKHKNICIQTLLILFYLFEGI